MGNEQEAHLKMEGCCVVIKSQMMQIDPPSFHVQPLNVYLFFQKEAFTNTQNSEKGSKIVVGARSLPQAVRK